MPASSTSRWVTIRTLPPEWVTPTPRDAESLDRVEQRQPHGFRVHEHHVRFNLLEVDGRRGGASATPSARRRARSWSSWRRFGPSSSAIRPAAAMIPAWRHAPPYRIFSRRASRAISAGPHRTEPIGAPSPFERQNIRVSTSRGDLGRVDPGSGGGVEDPGAVEVDRHAGVVRDLADGAQLLERHHAPARAADRVLDRRAGRRPRRRRTRRARGARAPARRRSSLAGPASTVRYAMPASAAAVITSTLVTWSPAAAATRWPGPENVQPERRSGSPSCPSGRTRRPPCRAPPRRRSCSRLTVGSSSYQSSPTSASAIARRIASDGFVTVSERRSTRKRLMGAVYRRPSYASAGGSVQEHRLAVDVADLRAGTRRRRRARRRRPASRPAGRPRAARSCSCRSGARPVARACPRAARSAAITA